MDLHRLFFLLSLTVMWYTCLRWPFHSITYSQLTHSLVWQCKQKAELSHPSREWAREIEKEPEREREREGGGKSVMQEHSALEVGGRCTKAFNLWFETSDKIHPWLIIFLHEYILQNQWESTVVKATLIVCYQELHLEKNPICAFCIWLTGGTHGRFICRQLLALHFCLMTNKI